MALLKPWYKVEGLTPREDLRDCKPLDASEFAVQSPRINERVQAEIQKVFAASQGIQPYPFPEKSSAIPNRAVLTLAVLAPDHSMQDSETLKLVESMTRESGTSDRTFKSALIWAIADTDAPLREEARNEARSPSYLVRLIIKR